MKVWIISSGDWDEYVASSPGRVTLWLYQNCAARRERDNGVPDCSSLRHDKWCSYDELEWQKIGESRESIDAYGKHCREWSKKFCPHAASYDIEEWEVDR